MRPVWASLLALTVAAAVFALFPGLDMAVSRGFYDGSGFPVELNPVVEGVRRTLNWAEDVTPLAALMLCGLAAWRGPVLRLTARDWGYGFAVFAVGPGLLVNGVMKPFFGRARPFQVEAFGGPMHYAAPWQISGQCQIGCSFVSGEAAGSVALAIMLVMMLRANRAVIGEASYGLGLVLAGAPPLVTFWQRMAAGRHFLSDVVFGGLVVVLVAAVLAQGFYRQTRA